jgi:hypothetical protein
VMAGSLSRYRFTISDQWGDKLNFIQER